MEGRKEMVYLTTHSAHFIYGYMMLDSERGRKEMEGRKKMVYLTTRSAHFIYGNMMLDSERGRKAGRNWKEGRKWFI